MLPECSLRLKALLALFTVTGGFPFCFAVFFIPKVLPKSGLIQKIPITRAATKGHCMSTSLVIGEG
jgi:hypothetical protein